MRQGDKLLPGDYIMADNKDFILIYEFDYKLEQKFPNNRLTLYNVAFGNKVIWSSSESQTTLPGYVDFQPDGNFVFYTIDPSNGEKTPIWETDTAGKGDNNSIMNLQNDGNLVMYDGAGQSIWESNTVTTQSPTKSPSKSPSKEPSIAPSMSSLPTVSNQPTRGYDLALKKPNPIIVGGVLEPNEYTISEDGRFMLKYEYDTINGLNRLATYYVGDGYDMELWKSNNDYSSTPGYTQFQSDRNFCLNGLDAGDPWCTNTGGKGSGDSILKLQNDGNLVMYKEEANSGGDVLWAAGTQVSFNDGEKLEIRFNVWGGLGGGLTSPFGGFFKFVVPVDGIYFLEAVGAEGGKEYAGEYKGGKGAIISGHFRLAKGDILRIGVGDKGGDGARATHTKTVWSGGGGGGASSIVKVNGDFDSFSDKDNTLLIIAGGGGGAGGKGTNTAGG